MKLEGKLKLRFVNGKYILFRNVCLKKEIVETPFIKFIDKVALEDFLAQINKIAQNYLQEEQAKSKVVYIDFKKKNKKRT